VLCFLAFSCVLPYGLAWYLGVLFSTCSQVTFDCTPSVRQILWAHLQWGEWSAFSARQLSSQGRKGSPRRAFPIDLIAAIDLGWFAAIFRGAVTELPHGVDEERKDDDKDQSGNNEDEERKPVNRFGGSGRRLEDVRNARSLGERKTAAT